MPSDLRTSYLQVFSVHSARPPKQLEHPRHWVLQLRCGQDYWVFPATFEVSHSTALCVRTFKSPSFVLRGLPSRWNSQRSGYENQSMGGNISNFGLTPDQQHQCCLGLNAFLGSGCPLSSKSDARMDCTDDMAGAKAPRAGCADMRRP